MKYYERSKLTGNVVNKYNIVTGGQRADEGKSFIGFLFAERRKMGKLNVVYKPITEIRPYENNPRHNDEAVPYVKKSIEQFGFKNPIIIDADGVIIAGHTRYKAAQELGFQEVPIILADDLTPEQVRAFRIADNKVSDYSIWDNKLLLDELRALEEYDDIFTGFETDDMWDNQELDEAFKQVVTDNDFGMMYEVVFRSQDESKIQKIKEIWDGMMDEEDTGGGDFWETSGGN